MDYDYILNKAFSKSEYFIIKQFKEFKNDNRTFSFSIDKIRFFIADKYSHNSIGINFNLFEICYRIFNHHEDYYDEQAPISKIINNEVKEEFDRVLKTKKPIDKNFREIDNYTFNRFIYDLIVYDTFKRIENRLSANSEFYKLIYESGKYSSFTLEKNDGHIFNSNIYTRWV